MEPHKEQEQVSHQTNGQEDEGELRVPLLDPNENQELHTSGRGDGQDDLHTDRTKARKTKIRLVPVLGARQAPSTSTAAVAAAVAAPLLQRQRPKSAPRERRAVNLPRIDVLEKQKQEHVIDIQGQEKPVQQGTITHLDRKMSNLMTSSGRIAVYCVAEKFDKIKLKKAIQVRKYKLCDGISLAEDGELHWETDVLHSTCRSLWTGVEIGNIFFFEFGVVVFWGFEDVQEETILKELVHPCSIEPLKDSDIEDEEFRYQYTEEQKPRIANDTIVMGLRLSENPHIKLSICYALAQSTKLKIYESRISREVDRFIELPRTLATTGTVELSKKEIHMLIGTIFLEKCAVNLLGTVLDTPEFFWEASDALGALYDAIFEYLEIEDRVEILNARFEILEAMLDMLRDHQQNEHSSFLEWIVIILIIVEVVIGLVEIFGFVGIIPHA